MVESEGFVRRQLRRFRKDVLVKLVFEDAEGDFLRVRPAVVVVDHHSAHPPLLLGIGAGAALDGGEGDLQDGDVLLLREDVGTPRDLQIERAVGEQLRAFLDENGRLVGVLEEVLHAAVHEALVARRHRERLRLGDFEKHGGALGRGGGAGHLEGTLGEQIAVREDGLGEMEGGDVVHRVEELELHVRELRVENALRRSHRENQRIVLRLIGLAGHRVHYTGGKTDTQQRHTNTTKNCKNSRQCQSRRSPLLR